MAKTLAVYHGTATGIDTGPPKTFFSGLTALVDDTKEKTRKTRLVHTTKAEQIQIDKLKRVYEGVYGVGTCPEQFKLEQKTVGEGSMMELVTKNFDMFQYTKGFKPDDEYFHTTNWYRGVDSANGNFRPEAKAMINIICTFQSNKSKTLGVASEGYPDDPENLFLEEFKTWVKDQFANFTEKDKENIRKRIGYLEDILCKEGLFDNPNSTDIHTVQKVVVHVRRILKTTIQTIETNLQHVDAGRSLDEIMNSLRIFMDESASLLWFSFRERSMLEGQVTLQNLDLASKLHIEILSSHALKQVLPHRSPSIKDPANDLARPSAPAVTVKKAPPPPAVIEFNDRGLLQIKNEFLSPPNAPPPDSTVAVKPVELDDEALKCLFVGDASGFDRNFRGNGVISQLFLESYAFLLELGSLFGVLKQAKGAAQTGGTMLLYGAANAHFNALLELTERLTDGMRSRLNKIVEIGEARFEQLVELNWATVLRCPWIANYRELPRTLIQVEKNATEVFKHVSKARSEANALTLKERKEQAEEETQAFLSAADGLTKRAGKSLSISYNSYTALEKEEENSVSKIKGAVKDSFAKSDAEAKKAEEAALKKAMEEQEKELEKKKTTVDPSKSGLKQYALTVKTSSRAGAGTDANVFVVLSGTAGKTDEIQLPDENKTRFECNGEDVFDIDVEGDIGELNEITLGHDNSGHGADWRVKWAEVVDKSKGGVKYIFLYDCDIGGKKKKGEREGLAKKPQKPGTERPGKKTTKKT